MKQKHASSMNMAIAGMHRFTIQLVALMLAIANLMALCLSALSVVAGVLTVTIMQFPASYALWAVAGIVGPLLSLLVESGTLNRLIRVRLMNREIADAKTKMEVAAEQLLASVALPDPNQSNYTQAMKQYRKTCATIENDTRKRYKRATREQRKTKRLALIMALACAGASAFAGGIFYHIILAGLGDVWDMAASVVFPLVVTGTFISTELNKDEQEATIREGFGGGALAETAIREETKLQAFKAVSSKAIAYLDNPEAEKDINEGTRFMVLDILAQLNEEARKRTRQRQEAGEFEALTGQQVTLESDRSPVLLSAPTRQDSAPVVSSKKTAPLPPLDLILDKDETGQSQEKDTGPIQAIGQSSAQKETFETGQPLLHLLKKDTTPKASTRQKATAQKDREPDIDATTARILAHKKDHPKATQTEIAEALDISVKTVQRKLAAIKTA